MILDLDGSRGLSDPWTSFTQFTLLEEKTPDGYMWSGGRLTRKQLTSRPDHLWPELQEKWERMTSCRRSKSGHMKTPFWITHADIKILNNLFLNIVGKPVETSRSNYSQDYGPSWSSQVWKSGDGEYDRPGQPEKILGMHCKKLTLIVENIFSAGWCILQGTKKLFTIERGNPFQRISKERLILKFIVGSDTTEFVNKVRNQVRIRQKRMSSFAENCTEHSIIWGMFMATTLNAATFMGKNYSTMQNVVQNEENLTLKQMFDITAQTIHNEEEI